MITEYVSQYVVSALPKDDPEHYTWAVEVQWRGTGWAVVHRVWVFCKSDGRRKEPRGTYDRNPSGRSDHHLKVYRHNLDDALSLARKIVPRLVVNGRTAEEFVQWRAAARAARGEAQPS